MDGLEEFSIDSYVRVIGTFRTAGYCVTAVSERCVDKPQPRLLLRHDVDLDLKAALTIAEVEAELGVSSTYFLWMRSPFYNVLSRPAGQMVNRLHSLGHTVALHVGQEDSHEATVTGAVEEARVFAGFYPFAEQHLFSVHRPFGLIPKSQSHLVPSHNASAHELFGFRFVYISDSTGTWRDGHPLTSRAFESRQDIQLLTHPVWWIRNGASPYEKLQLAVESHAVFAKQCLRAEFPRVLAAMESQRDVEILQADRLQGNPLSSGKTEAKGVTNRCLNSPKSKERS